MKFLISKSVFIKISKSLIFSGLFFFAVRSIAIEVFLIPPENNYIVPAGQIMEPQIENFTFAVASDTGAKNGPIEQIVKNAQKQGNSFLLYLGDLVRYRNISHFRWIISELDEKLDFPFYMIPGNHEITNRFGRDNKYLYKMIFGSPYYWFSYGKVMFIGLDSSEEKYDEKQLKWLEDILIKIRPHFKYCIIYTHVPPTNNILWKKKINIDPSVKRLGDILKNNKIDLLLAGHIHQYSQTTIWGIPLVTLMSSGQKIRSNINKYGYVSIEINKQGVKSITPHYLKENIDNEYIELLISNILVDDRFLVVSLSLCIIGFIMLIISVLFLSER